MLSNQSAVLMSLSCHFLYANSPAALQNTLARPANGSTYSLPEGGAIATIVFAIRALPPGYEKVGGVDLTYFLCLVVGSGRFSSAEMVSSVSCHPVGSERVIPMLVGGNGKPCSASFLIGL